MRGDDFETNCDKNDKDDIYYAILFITLFKNKKEGQKGTALDSVAHNACVVLTTDQPGLSTFSIRDTTLSNAIY